MVVLHHDLLDCDVSQIVQQCGMELVMKVSDWKRHQSFDVVAGVHSAIEVVAPQRSFADQLLSLRRECAPDVESIRLERRHE